MENSGACKVQKNVSLNIPDNLGAASWTGTPDKSLPRTDASASRAASCPRYPRIRRSFRNFPDWLPARLRRLQLPEPHLYLKQSYDVNYYYYNKFVLSNFAICCITDFLLVYNFVVRKRFIIFLKRWIDLTRKCGRWHICERDFGFCILSARSKRK